MAYEVPDKKLSLVANADLSALQYTFVKLVSGEKVDTCTAVTDIPIGVLQNKPKAGDTAEVLVDGVSKIKCSAAIAVGAQIATNGSALATTAVAGTDTTKYIVATALQATAAANELCTAAVDCVAPNRGA